MGVTYEDARRIVERHLEEIWASWPEHDPDRRPVIVDRHCREYPFGWYFFWDSAKGARTGYWRDRLVGAAPLVVDRAGNLWSTGGGHVEWYLEDFPSRCKLLQSAASTSPPSPQEP